MDPQKKNTRRMVRIVMADINVENIKQLEANKGFLLQAELPLHAELLGACAVPSMVDMLGFSGGGGPPAFAYFIDPDEDRVETRLLMTVVPEEPFPLVASKSWTESLYAKDVFLTPCGVIQCMGILLMGFEWRGSGARDLGARFKEEGALILPTQNYQVPAFARALLQQKAQQHIASKEKPAGP